MNKRIKSLVLSAALVASMAILGGCGSNNVGYVDSAKVENSTEKAPIILPMLFILSKSFNKIHNINNVPPCKTHHFFFMNLHCSYKNSK